MYIFFIILVSFLVFSNYKYLSKKINILDNPDNTLKKHKIVTAPIGGILIAFLFLIFSIFDKIYIGTENLFFSQNFEYYSFIFSFLIFLILGVVDDKISINPLLKLLIFILILIFICNYNKDIIINYFYSTLKTENLSLGRFSIFFTIFCFLSYLQAFNMYDGADKQSGLYSFICLFYLYIVSDYNFFLLYILIPIFFFIIFNKKGQIFLGNSGSNFLSFLIAFIVIKLSDINNLYAENIFVLFAIPGFDMIRLFYSRIRNKKNPIKGDLNHLHHLCNNKFNYLKSLIIISSLTVIPVLGMILKFHVYSLIIFQFISYVLLVYSVSRSN